MKNICKIRKHIFRYDRANHVVDLVCKATPDMLEDNKDFMEKFGRPLWPIDEDGYHVIMSVGLMPENWDNKDARIEYLTEFADEYEEEVSRMSESVMSEFC